jgi:hypothetical protein
MWFFVVLVALILIVAGVVAGKYFGTAEQNPWPLAPKPILSEREQLLFRRLEAIYPNHRIFVQVALSQMIAVKSGTADFRSIRNRYSQLVADFVLCRRDFGVIAVIELDDSSHASPDRQDADRRKTKAVESAGFRMVRISQGPIPSDAVLGQLIDGSGGEALHAAAQFGGGPLKGRAEAAGVAASVLGVAFVVLAIVGGWFFYSQFVRAVPSNVVLSKPVAPSPVVASQRNLSVSQAAATASAVQQAEERRLAAERALVAQQTADALAKRKEAAWAQFYKAPVECEHPPAWSDQVDCGNRYIRAKREFEKLWRAESTATSASTIR